MQLDDKSLDFHYGSKREIGDQMQGLRHHH